MRKLLITLPVIVLLCATATQARLPNLVVDFSDLTKVPAAKKLLDQAASELKEYAQGNEGGVSIKSASAKEVSFDWTTGRPISGRVTAVFDLHHRHRVMPDREMMIDTPFGRVTKTVPGIVAYDRHDDIYVEFDLKEQRGRARIAKGPLDLPLLPKVDWDLWVNVDMKNK
jgi:hypothetical protein